jgi:hypothetical protein
MNPKILVVEREDVALTLLFSLTTADFMGGWLLLINRRLRYYPMSIQSEQQDYFANVRSYFTECSIGYPIYTTTYKNLTTPKVIHMVQETAVMTKSKPSVLLPF